MNAEKKSMTKELITRTKQEVDEVTNKYEQISNQLSKNADQDLKQNVDMVVDQLRFLKEEVERQLDQIRNVEKTSESEISQMEKNIYNSIDSFNEAFTKAGSIFSIN